MTLNSAPRSRLSAAPRRAGRWLLLSALLALAACDTPPVAAQSPDGWSYATSSSPAQMVPERVGRVGRAEGAVWLDSAGGERAISAPLNWPVSSGDVLSTGGRARAEIDIGSTRISLDDHTRLRLRRIDDEQIVLDLERGSIGVGLITREAARELEVLTPAGRMQPRGPGVYRVDVDPDGRSIVTTWREEARVLQGGSRVQLGSYQSAELYPDGSWRMGAPAGDEFARRIERLADFTPLASGVSPEMPGADALMRHGDWIQTEWGATWFPRSVGAGWAPYRDGRWVWISPWGWTWIDDAPWGFAPSHYGRWVQWQGRWGWIGGGERPSYAPALVRWHGIEPPRGHRIEPGRWQPLPPQEAYRPSWRRHDERPQIVPQPQPHWPRERDQRPDAIMVVPGQNQRPVPNVQISPALQPSLPAQPAPIQPRRGDWDPVERGGRQEQPRHERPGGFISTTPAPAVAPPAVVISPALVPQQPAPVQRPVIAPPAPAAAPQMAPMPAMRAASSPGGDERRRALPVRRGGDEVR
ncbi:MAG: hypothetical protein RJA44_1073 [Pseudomonadota bacterium]